MSTPAFISKHFKQTIVYWAAPVPDGYGGHTYTAPVELDCRIEEVIEIIQSEMDEEIISRAAAYLDRQLDRGGYVYVGTLDDSVIDDSAASEDPKNVEGAMVILANEKIPRLGSNSEFMYKVYLNVTKELRPPYVK